jgi:hypothetical protein
MEDEIVKKKSKKRYQTKQIAIKKKWGSNLKDKNK